MGGISTEYEDREIGQLKSDIDGLKNLMRAFKLEYEQQVLMLKGEMRRVQQNIMILDQELERLKN